jgi:hypothetical protein
VTRAKSLYRVSTDTWFFPLNTFYPQLVKSTTEEPIDNREQTVLFIEKFLEEIRNPWKRIVMV